MTGAAAPDGRAALLAAAAELFAEEGVTGVAFDDIAARAGMTPAEAAACLRQRHGGQATTAGVLAQVIGAHGKLFLDAVLAFLSSEGTSLPAIRELGVIMQAGAPTREHVLLVEALAAAVRDEELRRLLAPHVGYVQGAFDALIAQGQDEGLIDPNVDVDALVHLCLTLMFGSFVVKALGVVEQPDRDAAGDVLDRLLRGFAAPQRWPRVALDLRDRAGGQGRGDIGLAELRERASAGPDES